MAQNLKREDKIDEQAREMFNAHPDLQGREHDPNSSYANSGLDQAEAFANDPVNASQNDVKNREETPNQFYNPTDERRRDSRSFAQKATGFIKSKKGATTGIFGGMGIAGIVLSSLFGNFTALINVQANGLDTNDSRSAILDRRFVKRLEKISSSGDSSACKVTKYSCRLSKMPNKLLSRMSEQGIKAFDANGKEIKVASDSGYVDKNPAKYEYTSSSGEKRTFTDIAKEYKSNPEIRSAIKKTNNMRYRAWVGKNINKIFYSKFSLRQDGGLASDDKNLNADNVDDELDKKLDSSSSQDIDKSKATFRDRFNNLVRRTGEKVEKSGGSPVLVSGSAYCVAVNMPGFIAGSYRAIQLIQILALVNDAVLSPAGKIKAGDAKPDEVSALGSKLTETVDGRSALDSAILLSAIGVNKNKTAPSSYAPGYGVYSNSLVQQSSKVSATSKGFCNKITSPEAAVSAAAIEGGATAATGGAAGIAIGAFRGVLKLLAVIGAIDVLIDLAVKSGVTDVLADQAYELASKVVDNYVEGVRGEKLGDALGVGLFAYFSTSGLAGGSAVLKTDQVSSFSKIRANVNNDYRQEALATLSPFDISSKYTFLGSIVSNLSTSGVLSNNLLTSATSLGSLMLRTPASILSPTVGASPDEDTAAAEARCSNADMFDVEEDVAMNPAGYPCVGIPAEYLNMSIDEVYDTVAYDVDEDSGEWKSDGDIAGIQADCEEADLESVGGCSITDKKRAAQSLYQYDKQVSDILDGSDDMPIASSTSSSGEGAEFRVATFNILHADDPLTWESRLKDSVKTLKDNGIDIAGLQEARPKQQVALKTSEYGGDVYDMWPTKAGDGADPEVNPDSVVLWNKEKFEFVSATQKKINYDGNRKVNIVKLKYIEGGTDGPEFYVLNTHDPIDKRADAEGGPQDRKDNNEMYADLIKNELSDAPVIFTGDFNSKMTVDASGNKPLGGKRENLSYCILTRDSALWHVSDAQQNKTGQCPSERDAKGNNLVDHIFISTSMKASNYSTIPGGKDEDGSDHNMVFSDVEIPGVDSSVDSSGNGTNFVLATYNQPVRGNYSVARDAILSHDFDVVGMQELSGNNYSFLQRELKAKGYGVYPDYPRNTKVAQHCSNSQSIFYNTDIFELVHSEIISYPRYDDKATKCADETTKDGQANAPILWLKDKREKYKDQVIIVMNIHNAANGYGGVNASSVRYKAGQLFVKTVEKLQAENPDVPIFLTGDFNEGYTVRNPGMGNVTYNYSQPDAQNNLTYCMFQSSGLMKAAGVNQSCDTKTVGRSSVDFLYYTPPTRVGWVKDFMDQSTNNQPHPVRYANIIVDKK